MELNQLQQLAFDRVVTDKAPITYLVGPAGTGKSYTVASILSAIPDSTITASTHKAATVLARMAGREALTTHKYLGYRLANIGFKQQLVPKQGYKPDFTTLLVIDEVSMLPNTLLKAALDGIGTYYDQILFVGDPVQLPAVSDKPNLSLIEPYLVELTQQMRQSSCSILADYMELYRKAITTGDLPSLATDAPAITLIDSHKEFCREYLKCTGPKKIIAYRNNVVDKYNNTLVEGNDFNIGDTVIIDKPIQAAGVHNQDVVTITKVEDSNEGYYNITFISDTGHSATVRHYYTQYELNKVLEAYKKAGNTREYWNLLDNCVNFKHIYATTVHRCQGDSIDNVFIDFLDIVNAFQATKTRYNNPISQDMFLRLAYVAISRMKTHCYIYTGNDNKGRSYDELTKDPDRKLREPKPIKQEPERWTL